MQRTITLKLNPNPIIKETIRQFNECCNYFLDLGFHQQTWSKKVLQKLGYYEARKMFPALQSSLVQGARDCAHDMLYRERCQCLPIKKEYSAIRFNQRTFKAFLDSGYLSITTIGGRLKIPISIPRYFRQYTKGDVSALRLRMRKKELYADLIVDIDSDKNRVEKSESVCSSGVCDRYAQSIPNGIKVLGIDRGIVNPAVCSDNQFFNSRGINRVRGRYAYLKSRLQAVGTRSAKRKLQRLAGRERRFQANINHMISKNIVATEFDVFALEDLSIKKEQKLGKDFNKMLGRWAHAQLLSFLRYKSEQVGKQVVLVPPEYTSQTCSTCGKFGRRYRRSFSCPSCGFHLDADLNASRNIAHLGTSLMGRLSVNQPIVARDFYAEHSAPLQLQASHF